MLIKKNFYIFVITVSLVIMILSVISFLWLSEETIKLRNNATNSFSTYLGKSSESTSTLFITMLASLLEGKTKAEQYQIISEEMTPLDQYINEEYKEIVFTITGDIFFYLDTENETATWDSVLFKRSMALASSGGGNEMYSPNGKQHRFISVSPIPGTDFWYSIDFDTGAIKENIQLLLAPFLSFQTYSTFSTIGFVVLFLVFFLLYSYRMIGRIGILENELKERNKELYRLSATDALTGIANRRTFDSKLAEEWRSHTRTKRPISLLMCDIDFFKKYNDTYGHQQGDICLTKVSSIISQSCKRPADLAARYGGEEFTLILPETTREGAKHIAEMLVVAVQTMAIPHSASSVSEYVTLSIGVATMIPEQDQLYASLVHKADGALYQAKKEGRNRASQS